MKLGVTRAGERIDRAVWRAVDPAAKLYLLASGDVELDADGLPVVRGAMLARTFRDIERALRSA